MTITRSEAARKTVLITGASDPSSLGACLARRFLNSGYKVIATCRPPLNRLVWLAEKGCEIVELDLTDSDSLEKAAERIQTISGGVLDALINNVST